MIAEDFLKELKKQKNSRDIKAVMDAFKKDGRLILPVSLSVNKVLCLFDDLSALEMKQGYREPIIKCIPRNEAFKYARSLSLLEQEIVLKEINKAVLRKANS